ncbi:MAG: hypothetical protein PHR35_17785 [Kiritimatiellae bacterium]|nr:hypothetical protein [Kiritimatiellia bacterium]
MNVKEVLSVLPVPVAAILVWTWLRRSGRAAGGLDALVKTHLLTFAFIAAVTEILSAFRWIAYTPVLVAWVTLGLGACAALAAARRRSSVAEPGPVARPTALAWLGWCMAALVLAAGLALALLYPPNAWDSMTYHMARVAHWAQNRSVGFYPTSISRQNYQMPLAEFAILHLQVLSGADAFANLVQWTCFAASLAAVALIAAELGLTPNGQALAVFTWATVPMAILQSSSTQNDAVVAAFVLAFALFLLRLRRAFSAGNVCFAALGLGLALMTKGVAYIYGAALGVALSVPVLAEVRTDRRQVLVRVGGLAGVAALAVVLNTGVYLRHARHYGTPIASGSERYWNGDISPVAWLSGVPRHLALHVGTPSRRLNRAMERTFRAVLGRQADNARATWPGARFGIQSFSRHEDKAGNPLHALLAIVALGAVGWRARRQSSGLNGYVAGTVLAGFLICALLKWQPWSSRLHLPLFALAAPVTAWTLIRFGRGRGKWIVAVLLAGMALGACDIVVHGKPHPLASRAWRRSRAVLYFTNRPDLRRSYRRAAGALAAADAGEVGLILGSDDWEYPLWALAAPGLRFRHVAIQNPIWSSAGDLPLPRHLVATAAAANRIPDRNYTVLYGDRNLRVLERIAP